MPHRFSSTDRRKAVSGEVVRIHLVADVDERSEAMYLDAPDEHQRLESEIRKVVKQDLGTEFKATLRVASGSIEFWVIVGTVYYAISNYKDFVESVNLLVSHLRNLVEWSLHQRGIDPNSVTSSWSLSGGLIEIGDQRSGIETNELLLFYLILSHAALLSVILWLVVGKFR